MKTNKINYVYMVYCDCECYSGYSSSRVVGTYRLKKDAIKALRSERAELKRVYKGDGYCVDVDKTDEFCLSVPYDVKYDMVYIKKDIVK